MEAVENAAFAYGEADGSATCQFMSQQLIDQLGGPKDCEKQYADADPIAYTIKDIRFSGDKAQVFGQSEGRGPLRLTLVRDDGLWLVSSDR